MNIASKKNQEKLKAALQAHDIKPGNKQAKRDSGGTQATKIICVRPKR